MRLNKEIISIVMFIIAFGVFIASFYGLGKAETDKNDVATGFAATGATVSSAVMLAVWFLNFGLRTPVYEEGFIAQLKAKL